MVIPCLNEERFIGPLVQAVRTHLPTVVVVDDGSNDATAARAAAGGAFVVRHSQSQGKGAALCSGVRRLRDDGFRWVILMDGDGQHVPEDIPRFLRAADQVGTGLIIGNRMTQPDSMPRLRRWTNHWMSRRISRLAGRSLPDTQCGFRMLPIALWPGLNLESTHFEIESEMVASAVRCGHPVSFIPVAVHYGLERTKIAVFADSWRWLRWWLKARRTGIPRPAAKRFQNPLQSPPPSSKLAL